MQLVVNDGHDCEASARQPHAALHQGASLAFAGPDGGQGDAAMLPFHRSGIDAMLVAHWQAQRQLPGLPALAQSLPAWPLLRSPGALYLARAVGQPHWQQMVVRCSTQTDHHALPWPCWDALAGVRQQQQEDDEGLQHAPGA